MFIGKQFVSPEEEDLMLTNQFKHMQEMANAPFGPNTTITKEDYIKKLQELDEAEKKHYNE